MIRSAVISEDQLYRYVLSRVWDKRKPILGAIWLNPSTADAEVDDPSLRRGMYFAEAAGYGGLMLCNLFAWRATNPAVIIRMDYHQAIGPLNNAHILRMNSLCPEIFVGWGDKASQHEKIGNRVRFVAEMIGPSKKLLCLGTTQRGQPRHPLYIASYKTFEPWQLT